MKRTWIGAALLGLLLAAGLLLGTTVEAGVRPGAEALRQAAEAAAQEDWARAEALTAAVRADWDRRSPWAEALAPHEDLEQIEVSFAQLDACAGRDGVSYSALCTALARQLEALGKAHRCSWENLL